MTSERCASSNPPTIAANKGIFEPTEVPPSFNNSSHTIRFIAGKQLLADASTGALAATAGADEDAASQPRALQAEEQHPQHEAQAHVTEAAPKEELREQLQGAGVKKPKPRQNLPGICEHGRQRSRCKQCDGSGVCEHNRLRHYCKQCGGSGICSHGRRRSDCKQCHGSSICEHGRQKRQCRECLVVYGVCEHGRANIRNCKDCSKRIKVHKTKRPIRSCFLNVDRRTDAMPMMSSAAVAPPVAGPAAAVFDRLSSAVVPHLSLLHLPCNSVIQPRIPLQCFGLPSAAPASPMPMPTMLPAPPMPSLMLPQQGLDPRLSVMLAHANYSSLLQQYDNLQAVRYLQQQMSFSSLSSAFVSDSALGFALARPFVGQFHSDPLRLLLNQSALGLMQLPVQDQQLAVNLFRHFSNDNII
jgi:hypothetical protein